jgi:hypothetical protein
MIWRSVNILLMILAELSKNLRSKRVMRSFLVPIVCYLLFTVSGAQAGMLAVFPVEDLTKGVNSANLEITSYLIDSLKAKGVNVVQEDDVLSFMAAERVRWLGYLDTDRILKARDTLGVDLILFGTISQRDSKTSPTFGLSLNLVRTKDGKTIWSTANGLSLADTQKILGINQPANIDELWPILTKNVLNELPDDISDALRQPLLFDSESGELPPTLQIRNIELTPRYAKPGDQIKCVVQVSDTGEDREVPQIFIKVANRIHLAQHSSEGLFYEAAWTGSEIEEDIFRKIGHEAINLATKDLDPLLFEGVWTGSEEDDVYPVSLLIRWPNGDQQSAFIGNYTVDSTPPDIDLYIKGLSFNGLVTFRDQIFIKPTTGSHEPFTHWRISVENESGHVLMGDEGEGNVPKRFYWDGRRFDGFPVEEGIYRLVLRVWDRAGNEGAATQEVFYNPQPPEMTLDVEMKNNSLQLTLDRENKDIPLDYWRIEIWNEVGELLKFADGDKLPVQYSVPLSSGDDIFNIEGIIKMRDMLGNKSHMDISDLYLLAMHDEELENQKTTDVPEEEEDSWVWLSENE